ncbi:SlyX family protein [Marivibrio halodurans]|uniref:SlyX family protein n=1 Tax=Marivibrio halodurans TaxID=2039722 RepID=A0A8J7SK77_9PROT|nr:SlyX family protein [Marivibrio halodurans]MBP5858263.1 SlyX family protein [Marivibrio halodurans]
MTAGDDPLIELQMQLAHQERTIDDLSDVVAAQAREIERLTGRVAIAERALADMVEALDRAGAPLHQKPPHY